MFSKDNNLRKFLDNDYSKLFCVLPSNAVVGKPIRVTVQTWDWAERICKKSFRNKISFSSTDLSADLPDSFSFKFKDQGLKTFENAVVFNSPGIHYVKVFDKINDIWTYSNPVKVTEEEPEYKWYWGDLHSHSILSDGTGTAFHNYKYARDVSMLDFCALSEHDHLSWSPYQRSDNVWRLSKSMVNLFYDPGSFVTLFAYEYTNAREMNDYGHYNVYYNTVDNAPVYSCGEEKSDNILELWSLLKDWENKSGYDAFTVPHHLLTDNLEWNPDYYDNEMVPLVELYQFKGSSEMNTWCGNPFQHIRKEIQEPGHSVQDGLARGYKFGFIASSDDHHGHPGHHMPIMQSYITEPASYLGPVYFRYNGLHARLEYLKKILENDRYFYYEPGGITGVMAKNLTRKEIFNNLKDRRCIAVRSVDRILIDFTVNGFGVGNGSELYLGNINTSRVINVSVAGTAPLYNITVIKNNETLYYVRDVGSNRKNISQYRYNFSVTDTEPIKGIAWNETHNTNGRDFYYVRVIQTNKAAAWIGPIWINSTEL